MCSTKKTIRKCKLCTNDIGIYEHHAALYCSLECKKEGRKIRDKLARDKKKMHVPLKTCRRCKRRFRPAKMGYTKYCPYCVAITTKGEEYHKCLDCNTKINIMKKRCYACAEAAKKKQAVTSQNKAKKDVIEIKKQAKEKGVTRKEPKIDSKWTAPRGSKRR